MSAPPNVVHAPIVPIAGACCGVDPVMHRRVATESFSDTLGTRIAKPVVRPMAR